MEPLSEQLIVEKPEKKAIAAYFFFWLGFSIYIIGYSFLKETQAIFYLTIGLQIIGMSLFVPSAVLLVSWKFDSIYLKFIFTLFCLWSLFIIARGFQFSFDYLNNWLFNAIFGVFLYFVPLIILFPKNIYHLKGLFLAIFILNVFYIFNNLLFFQITIGGVGGDNLAQVAVEFFSHFLALSAGFVLLTYVYHSKKRNLFALFIILLVFLIAAIRGRRGLMFISASIFLASYIVFIISNREKILAIILSFFFIAFFFIYGREIYLDEQRDSFKKITERLYEKTRGGVEEFFYQDMSPIDWIIGRGIDGKYYCPGIGATEGEFVVYREVIETGYLQIILKGGIVSLFLFVLIMLPAAFKGLFLSNNWLSKAAAIWILLFIGFSYPTTITSFSPNYLLLWLSAGICYSKSIRNKTDEEIRNELRVTSYEKPAR